MKHSVEKALLKWLQSDVCNRNVIVYTMDVHLLKAIFAVKKKYPGIKVCAIVADLPNMSNLSSDKSFWVRIASAFFSRRSYSLSDVIDSYVLLTRHMAEYLKISKPYCVVEGISTAPIGDCTIRNKIEKKLIMYSGTLHKRFGVQNLVEAFMQISGEDYQLIICGIGDSEDYISEMAIKDTRIKFYGQLSREQVLEMQYGSTVLINPRMNNEEFTKYSFPSKNLEYLSSGVPTIAYKLDGIPDDYDNHIYYVHGDTIDDLKNMIIEVCEMDREERNRRAKDAQEYVLKNKDMISQTKKIVELLNSVT